MKLAANINNRTDIVRTPFETPAPVPNLLQTLGRSLSPISANEPTPPLTPTAAGSPTREEPFFHLSTSENAVLGSPAEPGFPRKPQQSKPPIGVPPPSSIENIIASNTQGLEDSYFPLPITHKREKRRSSASERSCSFTDKSWRIERADQGNGGLRNAVEAAISSGVLEDKTWVGALGFPTDDLEESVKVAIEGRLREDYDSLVAFPKDKDFDSHYNHYCKEV